MEQKEQKRNMLPLHNAVFITISTPSHMEGGLLRINYILFEVSLPSCDEGGHRYE